MISDITRLEDGLTATFDLQLPNQELCPELSTQTRLPWETRRAPLGTRLIGSPQHPGRGCKGTGHVHLPAETKVAGSDNNPGVAQCLIYVYCDAFLKDSHTHDHINHFSHSGTIF